MTTMIAPARFRPLLLACSLLVGALIPGALPAQIRLTGALMDFPTAAGGSSCPCFWDTNGGDGFAYNFYLSLASDFSSQLNTGDGAGVPIDLALPLGSTTIFFRSALHVPPPSPDFGLNLFFDGDRLQPGASANVPGGTALFAQAAGTTFNLQYANVSRAGLMYTGNGYRTTLTGFSAGFANASTPGGLDRVNGFSDAPDGHIDVVGHFTLNTESIVPTTVTPEPVSAVLLGSGLVGLAGARRRRKRPGA